MMQSSHEDQTKLTITHAKNVLQTRPPKLLDLEESSNDCDSAGENTLKFRTEQQIVISTQPPPTHIYYNVKG